MQDSKSGLFYGWIVLACSFAATLSFASFYSFGVFIEPLEAAFGCSRAAICFAQTIHLTILVFSQILVGWLIDRYGPRLPLTLAAIFAGGGMILLSQVETITQFYVIYGLASIMSASQAGVLPQTIVQKWFVKKRGLALGIVVSGMGAGPLIIAPLIGYMINRLGWQTTYMVIGIITAAVLLLGALFIIGSPEEKGLRPYGSEETDNSKVDSRDKNEPLQKDQIWTLKEAIKNKTYLLICGYCFLSYFSVTMIVTHFVPFLMAGPFNYNITVASNALGILAGITIAGRIGWGAITPSVVGWKRGLNICALMCAIMMLWFLSIKTNLFLWIFIVFFGFFQGARTPLIPGTISHYFGLESLGSIIGVTQAVGLAGCVLAPTMGGFIHDKTGNYFWAFLICVFFWILALIFAFLLKDPRIKDKPAIIL